MGWASPGRLGATPGITADSVEKDSVALSSDLRKVGLRGVGMEAVTQLAASPLDGGGPLLEPSLEVVGGVASIKGLSTDAPFHVT